MCRRRDPAHCNSGISGSVNPHIHNFSPVHFQISGKAITLSVHRWAVHIRVKWHIVPLVLSPIVLATQNMIIWWSRIISFAKSIVRQRSWTSRTRASERSDVTFIKKWSPLDQSFERRKLSLWSLKLYCHPTTPKVHQRKQVNIDQQQFAGKKKKNILSLYWDFMK